MSIYLYKFSTGNPEGFDCFYVYTHEQEYSQADFETMVEEFIAESIELQHKETGYASIHEEHIDNRLLEKGFKRINYTAAYDYEPYWGKSRIKSPRIMAALELPYNECVLCDLYEPHEDDKSPEEIKAMVEAGTLKREKDTCVKHLMDTDKKCPLKEDHSLPEKLLGDEEGQ